MWVPRKRRKDLFEEKENRKQKISARMRSGKKQDSN